MNIKPQLAEDAILDKVTFPCWLQPKIDGVRAMNLNGMLTGRSLDPFAGFGITEYFSKPEFVGLDGEMTLGNRPNSADRLCSLTSGAMGRFKDETQMADLHLWVFDYLSPASLDLDYEGRYGMLEIRQHDLDHPRVHIVPYRECTNRTELDATIAEYFADGYEGAIIRNPRAKYKPGRATQKGQELWRVKSWGDFEILVTGVTEGRANGNEKKTNTLGRTERSSAKAGQVPNGQVGSIQGTLVKDLVVNSGELRIPKGTPVTMGSGKMTVVEAIDYFQNPSKIVGHYVKGKTMTHGVKDLPRFATYESHRLAVDM